MGDQVPVKRFVDDEDGAVTADWVVLTVFIIGLVLLIFPIIGPSLNDLAITISADVAGVATLFD